MPSIVPAVFTVNFTPTTTAAVAVSRFAGVALAFHTEADAPTAETLIVTGVPDVAVSVFCCHAPFQIAPLEGGTVVVVVVVGVVVVVVVPPPDWYWGESQYSESMYVNVGFVGDAT